MFQHINRFLFDVFTKDDYYTRVSTQVIYNLINQSVIWLFRFRFRLSSMPICLSIPMSTKLRPASFLMMWLLECSRPQIGGLDCSISEFRFFRRNNRMLFLYLLSVEYAVFGFQSDIVCSNHQIEFLSQQNPECLIYYYLTYEFFESNCFLFKN